MSAPTPVADLVAPASRGSAGRRTAWLRTGCALLVTVIYLCWWTSYAVNGLVAFGRYEQLEPGAVAQAKGAEFRLTSLVQTERLVNSVTGDLVPPAAGTVWLVADLEVTRRSDPDYFYCAFAVLGPDRRTWDDDSLDVSRATSSSCDKESAPIGRTVQVEAVFQIPIRYADELAGVVVVDDGSRSARQVLVPAR